MCGLREKSRGAVLKRGGAEEGRGLECPSFPLGDPYVHIPKQSEKKQQK